MSRGIKKSSRKASREGGGGGIGHIQRIKNQTGFYLLKNKTEA